MKRSKGVTPVVATVLLITISIAATGTAYTFIQNAQQSAQEQYYEDLNRQQVEEGTNFDVESMYEAASGNTTAVVRNTGRLRLMLDKNDNKQMDVLADGQLVNPQPGWEYDGGDPNPTPGETTFLPPTETVTIEIYDQFPGSSSQKRFKLVGRYGTTSFYTCFNDGSNTC